MKPARAALLIATVLTWGLAGCTSGTAPAPTPTSDRPDAAESATPSPSATPLPDLTALVVSATVLTLLDEQGATAAQLDFNDEDPAAFVDALSASSGVEPVETTSPGGFEGAEFTTDYEWDGLSVSTFYSPGQCDPDCRGTAIAVTSAEVAGIPVRTASGIQVGDTVAEAKSLGAGSTPELELAAEPEDPALFDSTTESTRVVILDVDADAGAVTALRASGWFDTFGNI